MRLPGNDEPPLAEDALPTSRQLVMQSIQGRLTQAPIRPLLWWAHAQLVFEVLNLITRVFNDQESCEILRNPGAGP
jgi:hypothetical protein